MDNDLLRSMLGRPQEETKGLRRDTLAPGTVFLGFPPELRGAFGKGYATFAEHPWRDRFSPSVAIFPKSGRIVVNEQGVFIPQDVLGKDVVVESERELLHGGGVRVTVSAQPRNSEVRSPRRVEVIECSRELQWMKEHRDEYLGQWVALDGDRLLAHGPSAREVYEKARGLGVSVPSIVRIEASDELPFGGW